jgi:hypothetical protein
MEQKCSLSLSQVSIIFTYPEPDQSNSGPPKSCVSMPYYACVRVATEFSYLLLMIVTGLSKSGVCGRSPVGMAGSNVAGDMDVCV